MSQCHLVDQYLLVVQRVQADLGLLEVQRVQQHPMNLGYL